LTKCFDDEKMSGRILR